MTDNLKRIGINKDIHDEAMKLVKPNPLNKLVEQLLAKYIKRTTGKCPYCKQEKL